MRYDGPGVALHSGRGRDGAARHVPVHLPGAQSETRPAHRPAHEGTPGAAASHNALENLELVTGFEPVTPSLRRVTTRQNEAERLGITWVALPLCAPSTAATGIDSGLVA